MGFLKSSETTIRIAALERQCADIVSELKTMHEQLSRLVRRESQLRAVLERDAELERYQGKLDDTLAKPRNRRSHRTGCRRGSPSLRSISVHPDGERAP